MALEINATLVVQAFNFCAAYFLLKTLFFKPAIKVLKQEQEEQDNVTSIIFQREEKLKQTSEEKALLWKELQMQFGQAIPPVNEPCVYDITVQPAQETHQLTKEQINTLAKNLQKSVVEKVSHVNE